MVYLIVSALVTLALVGIIFINQPKFGKLPSGERLKRIQRSPYYKDGRFINLSPTTHVTSNSRFWTLLSFLFRDTSRLQPDAPLPSVKTDLHGLPADEDVLVWLGHSSLLLQISGIRLLIDPVFMAASPVSSFNAPFVGMDLYKPSDMPPLDYIIITHDHWDHLDYKTILELNSKANKFICPLGVGSHLEYWGISPKRIMEMDWDDHENLGSLSIDCLPARHFSGRNIFFNNKSLWASFLIQTPSKKIYIGGDSGYGVHFADIGNKFGSIDLAILEQGQYDKNWALIHMQPEELPRAVTDLQAHSIMTVHNSKYALSNHPWHAPLEKAVESSQQTGIPLLTPMIGEPVHLNHPSQPFHPWWELADSHKNH